MTALMTVILGIAMLMLLTTSCHKSSSTPQTLYDSLGGTTMVADPANSGAQIEKGYLGIRTVVDSAIFIIAGDTTINGYFKVLLTEVTSGNLSGYQVARQLRSDAATSQICLIALSGFGGDESRAEAEEAGFDQYLVKPVEVAELTRVLAQSTVEAD